MKSGQQLKLEGIELATINRVKKLRQARIVAKTIAMQRDNAGVTADDVRRRLIDMGLSTDLQNAWGALFSGRNWRFTGEWRNSKHPSNHARAQRVWRYVK